MRKTTGAEPSPRPPARLLTGGEVDRDDAGNPLEHLLDRAAALLSDEARQREEDRKGEQQLAELRNAKELHVAEDNTPIPGVQENDSEVPPALRTSARR